MEGKDRFPLRRVLTAAVTTLLFSAFVLAQTLTPPLQSESPGGNLDRIVPYVPTPPEVVEKMLELARVGPDDVVYDLGSGDGRIVIMAAKKFKAHAVGVELDPDLFQKSSARIVELGLQDQAKILHENLFQVNVRHATVVTLYLLTSVNERLRPVLEKELRSGARVVSHDFQVPGWEAEKTEDVVDNNGVSHKILLYVRP